MKKHPLLSTFVLLVLGLQYGLGQNAPYRSLCVEVVDRTTLAPLTGATVSVKGHPRHAAFTDTDGRCRLDSLKNGDILQVDYIGYLRQEIRLKKTADTLRVLLKENTETLQDVVVVAYATADYNGGAYSRKQAMPAMRGLPPASYNDMRSEKYAAFDPNGFIPVEREPLSTFALDVDQAAYTNVRRMIQQGQKNIPSDAVRTEEFINYFDYSYPAPQGKDPLRITAHYADCPWNPGHRLLMIGLKAKELAREQLPPSNFVFLIDNSGSMHQANRLPLVVSSLKMLVAQLKDQDRVSLVTYGGGSEILLQGIPGSDKDTILAVLDRLKAEGFTAGEQGIRTAYSLAERYFIPGGNNRVIIASDGDFNVGASTPDEMEKIIAQKRKGNIFLTVLGFGMGNYKDDMMQTLAEKGNGNYAYIDSAKEAERILVGQFAGTAFTLAKDVKIQVEFNPAVVAAYRLIGYESRLLEKEDFNDPTKDGGELGLGQSMTAMYEIIPQGVSSPYLPSVDSLRYGEKTVAPARGTKTPDTTEVAFVKVRYKAPEGSDNGKIVTPVPNTPVRFASAHPDLRFAAAVVEFAQLLSDNPCKGSSSYRHLIETARAAKGEDPDGDRAEFIQLARTAGALQ